MVMEQMNLLLEMIQSPLHRCSGVTGCQEGGRVLIQTHALLLRRFRQGAVQRARQA